jgi:hypothetical protein
VNGGSAHVKIPTEKTISCQIFFLLKKYPIISLNPLIPTLQALEDSATQEIKNTYNTMQHALIPPASEVTFTLLLNKFP